MPKHFLRLTAAQMKVTSRDVEITVHTRDDEDEQSILGTLKVSQGSIDWRDGHDHLTRVLSWERFAEVAKKYGLPKKRR